MGDTIFRTKTDPTIEKPVEQKEGTGEGIIDIKEEPPYLDYQRIIGHPYIVDHFKLGDTWRDKLGGFEKEVESIDGYFKDQIEQGQIQNNVSAIKEKVNKIYRLCGIDKTERVTMQIERLAAYIQFLKKTDDIKLNHYKYA